MHILKKIKRFVEEIATKPNIIIEDNNSNKLNNEYHISNRLLRRVQSFLKQDFPKCDFQYDHVSSLKLGWSSHDQGENIYLYGGYEINGVLEVIALPSHFWEIYNDSRFWKTYQKGNEEIDKNFLTKLNYFHKSGHGDDGTFGCLLREEGQYPCPIYFYDHGVWFKMNMSLEAYYDNMIFCKATVLWQYFYIDTSEIIKKLGDFNPTYKELDADGVTETGGISYLWLGLYIDYFRRSESSPEVLLNSVAEGVLLHMKRVLKMFPRLFPDTDITFFQEKHDALEKALKAL